jgi:CHAD domain-containing protein
MSQNHATNKRSDVWLDQVSSRACITDVARVAIPRRLEAVFTYVPLVVHHADRSDEYVHQLRVATRRSQTSIDLCAAVLPKKYVAYWKRTLRGMRRAAGAVRDFDVMLQRLAELRPPQPMSLTERDAIASWLRRRRAPQLRSGIERIRALAERRRSQQWRLLVSRVRWRGEATVPLARDILDAKLQTLAKVFFAQGAAVIESRPTEQHMAQLHRLRILAKRLRYALESAGGVYDDRLVAACQFIKRMQSQLGRLHDHANAVAFLHTDDPSGQPDHLQPLLAALAAREREALQTGLVEWNAWWTSSVLENFWIEWHGVVGGPDWFSKQTA